MKWYDFVSIPVMVSSVLIFTYSVTLASFTHNWSIIQEYNYYHEGLLELVVAWLSLPCIFLTLRDIIKKK